MNQQKETAEDPSAVMNQRLSGIETDLNRLQSSISAELNQFQQVV